MKRKSALGFLAALIIALPLGAVSFWEGTAVASSYGEFPQAGQYAACSSFPRNTLVEVTNLENSKSVQVLVTRSLDNPGVFIALSPEAASVLDIALGMVARVKVSLPQNTADSVLRSDNPGRSADPDLNPQALVERERAKPDSGLAPESKADKTAIVEASGAKQPVEETTVKPAAANTGAKVAEKPVAKTEEKPAEKVAEKPAAKATVKPDAIGDQRAAPFRQELALKPSSLPDTPLEEKTPLAVEAKTDLRDGQRADALTTSQAAAAKALEAQKPIDAKPEALSLNASVRNAQAKAESPSFALTAPGLDSLPAKAALPETAQVIERTPASLAKSPQPRGALALPELAPREKPESALTRLNAPASSKDTPLLAKALPELRGENAAAAQDNAIAEALTMPLKGGQKAPDQKVASLALPGLGEAETPETATPMERLVVIRKQPLETSLSLADPELATGETGAVTAEERLLASRRSPAETSLTLAEPEIGKEEAAPVTAEERLLASKRSPVESALALADPELAEEVKAVEEPASAEVRLTAAKREPAPLVAKIPDPELTDVSIVTTEEKPPEAYSVSLARPSAAKAAGIALVGPELPAVETVPESSKTPEVAVVDRPLPESAHNMLGFEKESPELLAPEEKKPVIAEAKPTAKAEAKPEIVESLRKGAEALAALNVQRLEKLAKGMYFVQLGVYRSGNGAALALKKLTPEYPLSYQEEEAKDSPVYHVFIGPLKKDESGIVLYRMKSMGFKDAFVRKGD